MPRLSDIQIRDPFVVRDRDEYYLFGSTDPDIWRADGIGFDVYRSIGDSLLEWDGPIPAFRPRRGFFARKNFWAPEVWRYRGDWYMFATFMPCVPSGPAAVIVGNMESPPRRGTAILKSATGRITGPYVPHSGGPVTPPEWETLDGTLYIDDGGAPWMVFCHEWQQVGDGTVEAMPLASDLSAAAGAPTTLFRASQAPWSAPLAGRAPGSYVTDGPFLFHDSRGYLRCLWSTFDASGNYAIGEAVSVSNIDDDGASPAGVLGPWRVAPEPLFTADGGHGMLFRGPGNGVYLAIHSPNATPLERAMFLEVAEAPKLATVPGPAGWLQPTGKVIR